GYQHHDAHNEDPDQQLNLYFSLGYRQQNEGDQRDTGHAVGFEAVGAGAHGIAGVVPGAIGDDAGVAGVVFLDLEDDFHQVGTDVGNLGKDAAGDTQRRGAQRFANSETDEAWACVRTRDEEQNAEHDQQLHADQHHADAHAGLQRNVVDRVRLALETGERCARVSEGVDADSEPG